MNCEQAQQAGMESLLSGEQPPCFDDAIEQHLRSCAACRAALADASNVVRAIRSLPPLLLEQALNGNVSVLRIPRARVLNKWPIGPRFGVRAGAIAACMAILVSAWWMGMSPLRSAKRVSTAKNVAQVTPAYMGTVLVAGEPEHSLMAGQTVASDDARRREVRIRGHRILMEPGTQLSTRWGEDDGCMVALSRGRVSISVHRAASEGVFHVVTPQAAITVTGTVFDVAASFDRTELTVQQGTVMFTGRRGVAQPVKAGQAFVTDGLAMSELKHDGPDSLMLAAMDLADPAAALRKGSFYQERFAPLLRLRDYLETKKVAANELEILAASAELWSVQYAKTRTDNTPQYVHRRAGLQRAAALYGCETNWLTAPDASTAARSIEASLSRGDLVLAFGLDGNPCQLVTVERLRQGNITGWGYRFLGEPDATACAMCCIHPADRPLLSREEAAKAAALDMQSLLAGIDDHDYLVGQQALNAWADTFARSDGVALSDPTFKSLSLLARLWPHAAPSLSNLGPVSQETWYAQFARLLGDRLDAAFTASTQDQTPCACADRLEIANDLKSIGVSF